jgi:hypothetical protein
MCRGRVSRVDRNATLADARLRRGETAAVTPGICLNTSDYIKAHAGWRVKLSSGHIPTQPVQVFDTAKGMLEQLAGPKAFPSYPQYDTFSGLSPFSLSVEVSF